MMKKNKYLIFVILMLAFHSCKKEKKTLEFEQEVFYEIFPKIADSLKILNKLLPPPPPPSIPIYDKDYNLVRYDTTGNSLRLKEWKHQLEEYHKDTTKFVIALKDSIYRFSTKESNHLKKYFEGYELEMDNLYKKKKFLIDINNLKINDRVIFKPYSHFPKGLDIWKKEYDFDFQGILSFSEILFDKTKQVGVFEIAKTRGRLNGGSYYVIIKKKNNIWNIVDIIMHTIS